MNIVLVNMFKYRERTLLVYFILIREMLMYCSFACFPTNKTI